MEFIIQEILLSIHLRFVSSIFYSLDCKNCDDFERTFIVCWYFQLIFEQMSTYAELRFEMNYHNCNYNDKFLTVQYFSSKMVQICSTTSLSPQSLRKWNLRMENLPSPHACYCLHKVHDSVSVVSSSYGGETFHHHFFNFIFLSVACGTIVTNCHVGFVLKNCMRCE